MPVLLWAAPGAVPEVAVDNWFGFEFTWTSHTGTTINLRDPSNGRILLAGGVLGLHFPSFDSVTSRSANSSVQRVHSTRANPREIELPMHLWSDVDTNEFLGRDQDFWSLFSPTDYGTLTVQAPNRVERTIRARLTSGGNVALDRDPARAGWSTYIIELVADDPFWTGEPVTRSWDNSDNNVEFFDDALSPPFHIAPSTTLSAARLNNVGDTAVWVKWQVAGPIDELTIEVAGGQIGIPVLEEGDILVVDTNPRVGTAILNGTTDISGEIDPWDPRPLPAKALTDITLTMTGNGAVTGDFTPRFYRAFN